MSVAARFDGCIPCGMLAPHHCRRRAFEMFAASLPDLEASSNALLHAAIAISMHELPETDPLLIEERLTGMADAVRHRLPQTVERALRGEAINLDSLLAHLHDVLFDVYGLMGNTSDYHHAHNSYVSAVLQTKRGIPVTLTLIYKSVAERLGLTVYGINSPGHFLALVQANEEGQATGRGRLIDPYAAGRELSREEAFGLIEQVVGRPVPRTETVLATATHRQWLLRMLQNLQHIFATTNRDHDLAAMLEMRSLLEARPRLA